MNLSSIWQTIRHSVNNWVLLFSKWQIFIHVVGFHALCEGPDSDQNINSPTTIRHFLRTNFALNIGDINNFYITSASGRVERSKRLHQNIFLIMSEDDRRHIFKAKKKGRKKDVEKGKRKRQSRLDPRIAKGEFSKRRSASYRHELTRETLLPPLKRKLQGQHQLGQRQNLKKALIGKDGSTCKRPSTQQQNQGPPEKTARSAHKHALKEISPEQITTKSVHLGSGSYGSCYLGCKRA